MSEPRDMRWKPVAGVDLKTIPTNGSFAALDALRAEWEKRFSALSEDERTKVRHRTLRRLSVETGILERLYDVEWGLTLTLIAEGFTREVVERSGGRIDDRTLATLKAQMSSLEFVADMVRENRPLGTSFIKELHQSITRTQSTYEATDALGRVFDRDLPRGIWKTDPNSVIRSDGSTLEYCPPEQVASEMDSLLALYAALDQQATVHPIVKAAWLHHRFVQIHPFADGNGRVARALTMLVLEKHRYAPLVVNRFHRDKYLTALDAANDGNLAPLVELFVKLESAALASELDRPPEAITGVASKVARTLAGQFKALKERSAEQMRAQVTTRATVVDARIAQWFKNKKKELSKIFQEEGVGIEILEDHEGPKSSKIHWFRGQIIDSARTAGHYADFDVYTSWSSLRFRIDAKQLRFVASLHGAGVQPGVIAVTTFGELEPYPMAEEGPPQRRAIQTSTDAFRLVHTESVDQINARAGDLEHLLDEGLAIALAELARRN